MTKKRRQILNKYNAFTLFLLAKAFTKKVIMNHSLYIIGILLLLSTALTAVSSSCSKRQEPIDTKIVDKKKNIPTQHLVLEINRQARLYTTEYKIHKIVTYSDNPTIEGTLLGLPIKMDARIGDRKVAIPIDVTLKAYIDFSDFNSKNVERNDSIIIITLPNPHIVATSSKIDNRATKQYIDGFRSRYSDSEITNLASQGTDSILSHITQYGILEQAEKSAAAQLRPLLQRLGYGEENIIIRFSKNYSDSELLHFIERN